MVRLHKCMVVAILKFNMATKFSIVTSLTRTCSQTPKWKSVPNNFLKVMLRTWTDEQKVIPILRSLLNNGEKKNKKKPASPDHDRNVSFVKKKRSKHH